MGWRKFKDSIKNWRIGDYIRQFSIVTAGVMVTFIGSDLITNHSTQKEINSSMQLIITELEKNQKELLIMKKKYELDRTMSIYLIDSSFIISKFSIDTLIKYRRLSSQISAFFYYDDALEVLKSSSLMQKIEDKNLLLNIIETYKTLDETKQSISEYYNLKAKISIDISLKNDLQNSTNIVAYYEMLMSNNSMRSFCRIAGGFFDYDYFDNKLVKIDRLITKLKVQYQ